MDGYFNYIVQQLTFEELAILGILNDEDATAAFKSQKRTKVLEASGLTLANFRKTLAKLEGAGFIDVVTGGKEHKLFITTYGVEALFKSIEGVDQE